MDERDWYGFRIADLHDIVTDLTALHDRWARRLENARQFHAPEDDNASTPEPTP